MASLNEIVRQADQLKSKVLSRRTRVVQINFPDARPVVHFAPVMPDSAVGPLLSGRFEDTGNYDDFAVTVKDSQGREFRGRIQLQSDSANVYYWTPIG